MIIYPAKVGEIIKSFGKKRIPQIIPIHTTKAKFYLALIFNTDNSMYDFTDLVYGSKQKRDYAAMVQPWPKAAPCLGLMLLTKGRCGCGLISHEMTHAASMAITGSRLNLKKNEELALSVGRLVSQFYVKYKGGK